MDGGAWWAAVHGVAKSRTRLSDFTFMHWRRQWQPTPVFFPGESQGWGSLVGCRLWGHTELDTTEATQQQLSVLYMAVNMWRINFPLQLLFLFSHFHPVLVYRLSVWLITSKGFPSGSVVKNLLAVQETCIQSLDWKILWRKKWLSTPVFLPGKFHGQRSLTGYIEAWQVTQSQTRLSY